MPPITTYTLTRTFDDDDSPYASHTFTTSDVDAINAAHMLAAGFNTMSRNFLLGAALAVVYDDGRVQYDGKAEQIKRDDVRGKIDTPSQYAHIARSVLEETYADMQAVKLVLEEAGVETIPPYSGVRELQYRAEGADATVQELRAKVDELSNRHEFEYHARTNMEQQYARENAAAVAEMVSFVKRAHAKKLRIQAAGEPRPELDDRWRGMLDVLAKFLVVFGEADKDEGHAVARRLCGIED